MILVFFYFQWMIAAFIAAGKRLFFRKLEVLMQYTLLVSCTNVCLSATVFILNLCGSARVMRVCFKLL